MVRPLQLVSMCSHASVAAFESIVTPSTNSSANPLPPDPLPFGGDPEIARASAAAAQPFWGRLFRAMLMLALAGLTHVWLERAPAGRVPPTLATSAAQPIQLAQALTGGGPVEAAGTSGTHRLEPPGVTVRTELIPVDVVDRPESGARPIPAAAPQPTVPAAVLATGQREPVAVEPTPIAHRDPLVAEEPAPEPASDANLQREPEPEPKLTPLSASRPPLRELPRAIAVPAVSARAKDAERVIYAAPIVEPDPREQVDRVLQKYASAYERLDVAAAKEVYPSVNDIALRRAFSQLETQRVTFASCNYKISGSGRDANARCQGEAAYLPRVGPRTLHRSSREWTFDLAKADNGWHIVRATVR